MLLLLACSEWPRYAHLPDDTGTGRSPGTEAEVAWVEAAPRDDVADGTPATIDAEALGRGSGLLSRRGFSGAGWSATLPERPRCADGTESHFPVYETGTYAGDTDWWVIDLAEAGVLCSVLTTPEARVRTDVLLYRLGGACDLPVDGPYPDDDGNVLGYAEEGNTTRWAVNVEAGVVALVAAPYAPDTQDALGYRWGVALLGPDDAPDPGRCPDPRTP